MGKNNKIILVSPLPPPIGGIASWTEAYMRYVKKNNIDCKLVNSAVTGDRVKTGKINIIQEFKRLLALRDKIKEIIKNEKDVVIHYNASCFTKGLIRDFLVLRGLNTPIVYQCHCNLGTNINNRLAYFMFKKICGIVKTICVLNSDSLNFAKTFHNDVRYVPNFIEKIYYPQKEIKNELVDVCFVGRVSKGKGILELVEVAKQLPNIKFNIVGPMEIENLDISIIPNIKYWGPRPNELVIDILKKMDAYVLPSYSEGFPLGVLEAMSCGLPIIATNVGSIPDMLGNSGGILVEPGSSKQLIRAFDMLKDRKTRKDMSLYNIQKVRDEYLINVVMNKFLSIYNGK